MQLRIRTIGAAFIGMLAITLVLGCSKTESKENSKMNGGTTTTETSSIDPNVPLSSYAGLDYAGLDDLRDATTDPTFIYAYYAGCNCPVDFEEIASQYDQEFAATTDVFERNRILAALKPKIEEQINKIKGNGGLIKFTYDYQFKGYDFNTKSFHSDMDFAHVEPKDKFITKEFATRKNKPEEQYYALKLKDFKELPVTDEAFARKIEARRNEDNGTLHFMLVYARVTKTGTDKIEKPDWYGLQKDRPKLTRRYIEITPVKVAMLVDTRSSALKYFDPIQVK